MPLRRYLPEQFVRREDIAFSIFKHRHFYILIINELREK